MKTTQENTVSKLTWITNGAILASILIFGISNVSIYAEKAVTKKTVKPNLVYQEECGACHLAYPAGFMPEKSWNKILSNLEDHFGENAELDKDTNQVLKSYLAKHAMKKGIFNRLMRNFPKGTPTRITELPYFIRKHDEIPQKWVKNNPKVGSFSQCDKCHRGAARGDFEEDDVRIPGIKRWDD